jgi:hypothetical protein
VKGLTARRFLFRRRAGYAASFNYLELIDTSADPNAGHIHILLQNAINQFNLPARIVRTGSFGFHDLEPMMIADSVLYNNASPVRFADLVNGLINRTSDAPHVSELPLLRLGGIKALFQNGLCIHRLSGLPIRSLYVNFQEFSRFALAFYCRSGGKMPGICTHSLFQAAYAWCRIGM